MSAQGTPSTIAATIGLRSSAKSQLATTDNKWLPLLRILIMRLISTLIGLSLLLGLTCYAALGSNNKMLVGYYDQWGIYSPNRHIRDLPLELMTHLVYVGAKISDGGQVVIGDSYADIEQLSTESEAGAFDYLGNFAELSHKKQQLPQLKTLISIGGWNRSKNFTRASDSPEAIYALVESIYDFTARYNFDGVELDWATLGEQGQHDKIPDRIARLSAIVKAIRQQQGHRPHLIIFINLPIDSLAAPDWQASGLSPWVDNVSLNASMVYGGWNTRSDHLAPLNADTAKRSVVKLSQNLISRGIKAEKIVLNVASFALAWQGIAADNNGLEQAASSASWGSWDSAKDGASGLYNRNKLEQLIRNKHYRQYWDNTAKMNWIYNPEKFSGHFVTFENRKSLDAKINFLTEKNMAGLAIRQLHNDLRAQNSLMFHAYQLLHPLQGARYWLQQTWLQQRQWIKTLLYTLCFGAFTAIVFWIFRRYQQNKIRAEEHLFQRRQQQLQHLEWHLGNTLYLPTAAPKKEITPDLAESQQALQQELQEELQQQSRQLLQQCHLLLNNTQLGLHERSLQHQRLDLIELLRLLNMRLLQSDGLVINFAFDTKNYCIDSDAIVLSELIGNMARELQRQYGGHELTLTLNSYQNQPSLTLQANSTCGAEHSADYFSFKALYQRASQLKLTLNYDDQKHCFELYLPALKQPKDTLPIDLPVIAETEQNIDSVGDTSPARLQQAFNDIAGQRDFHKQLQAACEFFKHDFATDVGLKVYRGKQLISETDEISDAGVEDNIDIDDLTLVLHSQQPLSGEQRDTAELLLRQIHGIRRSLQGLLHEPAFLSELHTLASQREKIIYIQADGGYSGIFTKDKKDPSYISMRLRTIKQYIDDSQLLQIHRSYLINPVCVTGVTQKGKLSYELHLGEQRLPISRSYLPTLKSNFAHWFS